MPCPPSSGWVAKRAPFGECGCGMPTGPLDPGIIRFSGAPRALSSAAWGCSARPTVRDDAKGLSGVGTTHPPGTTAIIDKIKALLGSLGWATTPGSLRCRPATRGRWAFRHRLQRDGRRADGDGRHPGDVMSLLRGQMEAWQVVRLLRESQLLRDKAEGPRHESVGGAENLGSMQAPARLWQGQVLHRPDGMSGRDRTAPVVHRPEHGPEDLHLRPQEEPPGRQRRGADARTAAASAAERSQKKGRGQRQRDGSQPCPPRRPPPTPPRISEACRGRQYPPRAGGRTRLLSESV